MRVLSDVNTWITGSLLITLYVLSSDAPITSLHLSLIEYLRQWQYSDRFIFATITQVVMFVYKQVIYFVCLFVCFSACLFVCLFVVVIVVFFCIFDLECKKIFFC